DEMGVDCVITASQKGLMLPIGISFTAAGPKAVEVSKTVTAHREYWSWKSRMAMETYRRFCGTAPMHMVWGLMHVLDKIEAEGLDAVVARHTRLGEAVRRAVAVWAEGGALEFNTVDPAARSNSITCVRQVGDTDMNAIRIMARETFNVSLGGGLAALMGKAFRIGHMGDLNEPMLLGALGGVDLALKRLKVPHGDGALDAASRYLADAV
ncbi:MAG: aminotransferase, partial [Alphaproteobacteria bacterium]